MAWQGGGRVRNANVKPSIHLKSGGKAEPRDSRCKVWVGNISYETQAWKLRELFEEVGHVAWVSMIAMRTEKQWSGPGKPHKGMAVVEFDNPELAQAATVRMAGKEIDGRSLLVEPWGENH